MRKITQKAVGLASAVVLTVGCMVPAMAFAAVQEPSVSYDLAEGASASNVTKLTLIYKDDNLATNADENTVKEQTKVQVPVAINFVAQSNGTILGPEYDSNETDLTKKGAALRNFSKLPVHVSNIKLVPSGELDEAVGFVQTGAAGNTNDKVELSVRPTTATDNDYLDLSIATATGGANLTTSTVWNINAARFGTDNEVTPAELGLKFDGKIGGFDKLNPAETTTLGRIEWTVAPGKVVSTPVTSEETQENGSDNEPEQGQ